MNAPPSFPQLAPDDRIWRLDWFGECAYPGAVRRYAQPSIKVALSPLQCDPSDHAALSHPDSTDYQHSRETWIPIAALPMMAIGDLWQHGQHIASPDYQVESFKKLSINLETTAFMKAGLAIDEHFLLPLRSHPCAYTWLAGINTRMVQCILNPSIVEEERGMAIQRLESYKMELAQNQEVLDGLSEQSAQVILARTAYRAESDDARRTLTKSEQHLVNIRARKVRIDERSSTIALSTIKAKREHMAILAKHGTDIVDRLVVQFAAIAEKAETLRESREWCDKRNDQEVRNIIHSMAQYQSLLSMHGLNVHHDTVATLTQLQDEADDLRRTREWCEARNTDPVRFAVTAIRDYIRRGGCNEESRLQSLVNVGIAKLREIIAKLDIATNETARARKASIVARETASTAKSAYDQNHKHLENIASFASGDDLPFMSEHESHRAKLDTAKAHATARNNFKSQFSHAQRYVEDKSHNVNDTQLLEEKARLEFQVQEGREQQKADNASIDDMQGRWESLKGAAGTLHDAATALLNEFRAISKNLEEIEEVLANDTSRLENTDLYQAAENIRHSLDKTNCDPFLLEAIRKVANLAKNLSLDVQSKEILAAKKANDRAVTAYRDHKNGFCEQVNCGKIKGLSALNAEWLQAQERFDAPLEMKEQIEAGIKDRQDRCERATTDLESMRGEAAKILSTLTMDSNRALEILDEAMATTPNARFYVQASVISGERANDLMLRLYGEFEGKRRAQASTPNPLATQRRQKKSELEYLRGEIYRALFGNVSVEFRHPTIWKADRHSLTSRGLSEGMKTAISLMWIAKLAEFRLRQAIDQRSGTEGTRRQRRSALRKDRYFMILDGLFSNLSHDEMIDSAMESLRQSTGHFQLIGMIHHPRYINNPNIFPEYYVGRPFATDDGKHSWLTVDKDKDVPASLGIFGSHYKQNGVANA